MLFRYCLSCGETLTQTVSEYNVSIESRAPELIYSDRTVCMVCND